MSIFQTYLENFQRIKDVNAKELLEKRIKSNLGITKHYQVLLKWLIEQKIEITLRENMYGEFSIENVGVVSLFHNEVFRTIDSIRFDFLKTQDRFGIFSIDQ